MLKILMIVHGVGGESFFLINRGWRRILKLQDIARHIKWLIGKKIRVFLWSANWHPHGALAPKFGSRVIYNAASYPRAKVSSISGE